MKNNLTPGTTPLFKAANNNSVVLQVDVGKASFLTTGYLEVDAMLKARRPGCR